MIVARSAQSGGCRPFWLADRLPHRFDSSTRSGARSPQAPTQPVGTGGRLGRFTGEEMRTRNKVATAGGLAEGGWGFALCELC